MARRRRPKPPPSPERKENVKAEVRAVRYRYGFGAPSPISQFLHFFQLATARARQPSPLCIHMAPVDWRKLARAVRRWVWTHAPSRQLREALMQSILAHAMPYTNPSLRDGQAEYRPHRSIDPE